MFSDRIYGERLKAAEKEIIKIGSYLSTRHYHAALAGNISFRISEDCVLCTRHGADKGALDEDDIVFCAMDGTKIGGKGDPTSEFSMHRMAYRERSIYCSFLIQTFRTETLQGPSSISMPINPD
jgi:ribulose-5-phosphate 4-epimerase/fuculose-1-phosphate aldolase